MGAIRYAKLKKFTGTPDIEALVRFADAVAQNRAFSEVVTTSTDPKVLFRQWRAIVEHRHGGQVETLVQYLPNGGEFIEGARFFALDPEGLEWRSVDVKLVVNTTERDDRPQHNYAGLRALLDL